MHNHPHTQPSASDAVTNESTISGMVSQRYNKMSYFVILVLTAYVWFVSSYILCTHAAVKLDLYSSLRVLLAAFSPIITLGILIFPIVVVKSGWDLAMLPLDARAYVVPSGENANAESKTPYEANQQSAKFAMAFWHSKSANWHQQMHMGCVALGAGSGLFTVAWHLYDTWSTPAAITTRYTELAMFMMSFVFLFLFSQLNVDFSNPSVLQGSLAKRIVDVMVRLGALNPQPRKAQLYAERVVFFVEFVGKSSAVVAASRSSQA